MNIRQILPPILLIALTAMLVVQLPAAIAGRSIGGDTIAKTSAPAPQHRATTRSRAEKSRRVQLRLFLNWRGRRQPPAGVRGRPGLAGTASART